MTLDISKYAAGDAKPGKGTRDNKREKRLERNRESARKCRKKRKAFVGSLQYQCDNIQEENAMLHLENQKLLEMIKQLQNGDSTVITLPESTRKRAKCENGVSMATDFSESAAGGLFQAGHLDHLSALIDDDDAVDFGRRSCNDDADSDKNSSRSPSSSDATLLSESLDETVSSDRLHSDLAELIPFTESDETCWPEECPTLASPPLRGLMDISTSVEACSDLQTFVTSEDPEHVSFDMIELEL